MTPPAPPATFDAALPRGRVLIVDDEPVIGFMLTRMLGDEHEVLAMTDARKALAALDAGRFDAIVLDLMMPHMNGMEFFEVVRAKDAALAERVVFLTGGGTTPAARDFLARVANVVLEKPADMKTIRATIRAQVARARDAADA